MAGRGAIRAGAAELGDLRKERANPGEADENGSGQQPLSAVRSGASQPVFDGAKANLPSEQAPPVGGLGAGVAARGRTEGLHKLGVKLRNLCAQPLKLRPVPRNSAATAAETASPAAVSTAVVGTAAAALAALTVDPMLPKSVAAAVSISGATITNDIQKSPVRWQR